MFLGDMKFEELFIGKDVFLEVNGLYSLGVKRFKTV